MSEIGIFISALSVLIAFFALLLSFKASRHRDDRDRTQSASQLTRIETMLESVRGGGDDIRIELRAQQKQISEVTERVARLEELAKTAQRRIEIVEGRIDNEREDEKCH